jgi:hypothetical protein
MGGQMKKTKIMALTVVAGLVGLSHAYSATNEDAKKGTQESENKSNAQEQYWTPALVSKEGLKLEQELSSAGVPPLPQAPENKKVMVSVEYNPYNLTGPWLILGTLWENRGRGGYLTPKEAQTIDLTLDNDSGNPLTGKVRALDGADVNHYDCITSDGQYNLKNKNPVCIVLIQLPEQPPKGTN